MNTLKIAILSIIAMLNSMTVTTTVGNAVSTAACINIPTESYEVEYVTETTDTETTVVLDAVVSEDAAYPEGESDDQLEAIAENNVPLAGTPFETTEATETTDNDTDVTDGDVVVIYNPVGFPCCTTVEIKDGWATITNTHDGYFAQTIVTEDEYYSPNFAMTFTWR